MIQRIGYRLRLDESSWNIISKKTRNSIRKAWKSGVEVGPGELDDLRGVHWDPVYLPRKLGRNQAIFTARYDQDVIASMLVEYNGDKIIYKKAGSNPDYKSLNGNSALIWYMVQVYEDSDFIYFELGGSGDEGINNFKKQFGTSIYSYTPVHGFKRLLARIRIKVKRLLNV